jgi:hypothetical protein
MTLSVNRWTLVAFPHIFIEHKGPMPRWHVFASAYEGLMPAHLEINRFTHFSFRRFGIPIKRFMPNVLVNGVVGMVIFKVALFIYPPLGRPPLVNINIPSWDASVVRMFPSPRKQINWPTNTVITDDTILKFYQAGLPDPSLLMPFLGKFLQEHKNEVRPPHGDHHG